MQNYDRLEIDNGDVVLINDVSLFDQDETARAETILKALEGLSIISAQALLEKCGKALLQSRFSV